LSNGIRNDALQAAPNSSRYVDANGKDFGAILTS